MNFYNLDIDYEKFLKNFKGVDINKSSEVDILKAIAYEKNNNVDEELWKDFNELIKNNKEEIIKMLRIEAAMKISKEHFK
ncbi:hypothetical protein [Clostridium sp. KNHs214]|uniref:hypothetical protein n=1 Tax=Clostridium sp. KNHs214 TaxID=1540257 RepID=UPI0005583E28|nr:hypothetical protein [Clostridium sp. KNHs214]